MVFVGDWWAGDPVRWGVRGALAAEFIVAADDVDEAGGDEAEVEERGQEDPGQADADVFAEELPEFFYREEKRRDEHRGKKDKCGDEHND